MARCGLSIPESPSPSREPWRSRFEDSRSRPIKAVAWRGRSCWDAPPALPPCPPDFSDVPGAREPRAAITGSRARAPRATSAPPLSRARVLGHPQTTVERLAEEPPRRPPGHGGALASSRVATVLALAIAREARVTARCGGGFDTVSRRPSVSSDDAFGVFGTHRSHRGRAPRFIGRLTFVPSNARHPAHEVAHAERRFETRGRSSKRSGSVRCPSRANAPS